MRNPYIAAAVAAALASAVANQATAQVVFPQPSDALNSNNTQVYIAGSSAAATAVLLYIENTLCNQTQGSFSEFDTLTNAVGLPDMRLVTCTVNSSSSVFPGAAVTIWYRPEGGSAIGVLPVYNNVAVKQLSPASGCVTASITSGSIGEKWTCTGISGTASVNGTNDSWSGNVLTHNIDIGVSDLEPPVFGNLKNKSQSHYAGNGIHDPWNNPYATSFLGPDQSAATLVSWSQSQVFQQVFGFVVSTDLTFTDLPKDQIAAIYDELLGTEDWSQVALAGNTAYSHTEAIVICNRETGSGTRAAVDLWLNNDGCAPVSGYQESVVDVAGKSTSPFEVTQPADNLQTFAELDCVNSHAGAIGYVSIDNFSKISTNSSSFPNVKAIAVSGANPATSLSTTGSGGANKQNAGVGEYNFVYEATLNENPTGASNSGQAFYTWLQGSLEASSSGATSTQILVIPNLVTGNNATAPLQTGATGAVTSDFTRNGNSCAPLIHQ